MKTVILSVPYCEPHPMVAPVLLSACLTKHGIQSKGIDFSIEFNKFFESDGTLTDVKQLITMLNLGGSNLSYRLFKRMYSFTKRFLQNIHQTHRPEYIGLSLFTSESLDFGLFMCYLIRKYLPDVKIMVGGKALEVLDGNGQKNYTTWAEIADLVIVGDAESEIVTSLKENKSGLVFCQPQTKQDLDDIPVPNWDDYDLSAYRNVENKTYMIVTGTKGCVRECTFCDVASFWPKFIMRDPAKVANEIIANYQKTGITLFKFTDNLINGSITGYRTLNQCLVNEIPRTINYEGYAIFRGKSQMPEKDFQLAAEAGCKQWVIGLESGSEAVRFHMKKKFSNEDIDWSANMLYNYGITQNWLLMVGYPTETEDDFNQTLLLLKKYAFMGKSNKVTVSVTPTFSLLNNSPLITNTDLAVSLGLEQYVDTKFNDKFWTSTKFVDNNYPTRSRRWKELISTIEDMGYRFSSNMPTDKWKTEIELLDRLYEENQRKVFHISSSK